MSKEEVLRDIRKIVEKLNGIENGHPSYEIKKYRDLMNEIVGAIPDMLFITDSTGKFLYYFGDEENFYIKPVQFIGKKISEIFPEGFALKVDVQITKMLLGKKPSPIYYKFKNNLYEARLMRTSSDKILFMVRNIGEDIEKLLKVYDLNGKKN